MYNNNDDIKSLLNYKIIKKLKKIFNNKLICDNNYDLFIVFKNNKLLKNEIKNEINKIILYYENKILLNKIKYNENKNLLNSIEKLNNELLIIQKKINLLSS
jgi:hypothetical protein